MTRVLIVDYAWPTLDIERNILESVGAELVVAETGTESELLTLAPEADAIMVCWKPLSGDVLRAASRCTSVARYGVGVDNIDVITATELGIVVSNVPDFCTLEVADHTLALTLSHVRRISALDSSARAGAWNNTAAGTLRRLRGRTFGLVGYGSIAREVARRAQSFGYEVIAFAPSRVGTEPQNGVQFASSLHDLLRSSQVVSLHLPLTADTHHLIGAPEFAIMRPDALLVNTSRGGLVDQAALVAALREGRIGGAALDVLETEPPEHDEEIFGCDQAIVTPHAAFNSIEAVEDLQRSAAGNVAAILAGQLPSSVVNRTVLDADNLRFTVRTDS